MGVKRQASKENERMSEGKIEARRQGKKEGLDVNLQKATQGWRFRTATL